MSGLVSITAKRLTHWHILEKEFVTVASVKAKGSVLGQKKPAARKALNDITNKSGIHPKASFKNKQIASAATFLGGDSSSIKEKHLKYDKEMNNVTCDEAEEIPSAKLTDWLKSSTPWRSPIPHGSMMMPSTPLPWRIDSSEFTLKQD